MFQLPYHSLRPITTAHLAQTMALLSLTASELQQQVESELSSNPALEMVDEKRCPTCRRFLPDHGVCPVCSRPQQTMEDAPIVFISSREVVSGGGEFQENEEREESGATMGEELSTYVFRQIAPDVPAEDRRMAAYMLTHLD